MSKVKNFDYLKDIDCNPFDLKQQNGDGWGNPVTHRVNSLLIYTLQDKDISINAFFKDNSICQKLDDILDVMFSVIKEKEPTASPIH